MQIEKREAVRRKIGYANPLDDVTLPLTDPDRASFLLEPAAGKFPELEAKGIPVSENLQVQHLVALMAIGGAQELTRQLNGEITTPGELPKVQLIVDDYYRRKTGMALVGFKTSVKDREFSGALFVPGHPWENRIIAGVPNFVVHGTFPDEAVLKYDDLVEREEGRFLDRGNRLLDFVASEITALNL